MPRVRPVFNLAKESAHFRHGRKRAAPNAGRSSSIEAAGRRAGAHTLATGVGLTPTLDHLRRRVVADVVAERGHHQNARAEVTEIVETRAARVAVLIRLARAPLGAAFLEHAAPTGVARRGRGAFAAAALAALAADGAHAAL